jgi:hypothetical protein
MEHAGSSDRRCLGRPLPSESVARCLSAATYLTMMRKPLLKTDNAKMEAFKSCVAKATQ